MGGAKKKPAASKGKQSGGGKDKKDRGGKDAPSGPKKADITVMLTDEQASKSLGSKHITAFELAKQHGVKVSAANACLVRAAAAGKIKVAGGHSGHRIYQPA